MGFKTIIINEKANVNLESKHIMITINEEVIKVFIKDINCVIFNNQNTIMSGAIVSELVLNNVSVIICNKSNDPIGCFLPFNTHSYVFKQLEYQINWSAIRKKQLWSHIVKEKIINQHKSLIYNGLYKDEVLLNLSKEVKSGDSTNREAVAAKIYFTTMFYTSFTRDSESTYNYALNYGYKILASYISKHVASRGYLTQLGIHHIGESNAYNLTYDFIESFRPIVDVWVRRNIRESSPFTIADRHNLVDILNCYVYVDGKKQRISNAMKIIIDSYFLFLRDEEVKLLTFDLNSIDYEN